MPQKLKEIEKYKKEFNKCCEVIRRVKGRKLKNQVKIYDNKFNHIKKRSNQHHINFFPKAVSIKIDTDINNTRENVSSIYS